MQLMPDVLFLAHRLPYPPDKGDKIRSYHLLQTLRSRFSVHLGCFVDDPHDQPYIAQVDALCTSTKIVSLSPAAARVRSLTALLRGQALSIRYFFDRGLAEWVHHTLENKGIRYIVAYSSPMAQYVSGDVATGRCRVMDFGDADSDKWRQYSEATLPPMRQLYAREARKLADWEREIARTFDAASFVTQNEVQLFDRISPETRNKHHVVPNGVDTAFFDPELDYPVPYSAGTLPLVFTGMMNYRPNVDAVVWFARRIFPAVLQRLPTARLWVVGAAPTREVRSLRRYPGVTVTGRVPDVRPYLKHAALAVAPLRIARGVQNKVLEAMAMGCRVLCSAEAAAGLGHSPEPPITIAHSEAEFASAALQILSGSPGANGQAGRRYVVDNYNWATNLSWFLHPPESSSGTQAAAGCWSNAAPYQERLARVAEVGRPGG